MYHYGAGRLSPARALIDEEGNGESDSTRKVMVTMRDVGARHLKNGPGNLHKGTSLRL